MHTRLTRFVLLLIGGLMLAAAPPPRPEHRLDIYKAERRMELWVDGARVRTFRVGLGGAPKGDKARQGDSRTPEGRFYIAWKNPSSSFHRFLGLSYPMPRHAAAARQDGRIDRSLEKRVVERVRSRAIPPQTSRLGGYVGIHGGGSGADWTLGCVAVSDAEIEWLFARLRQGDRVQVYP